MLEEKEKKRSRLTGSKPLALGYCPLYAGQPKGSSLSALHSPKGLGR